MRKCIGIVCVVCMMLCVACGKDGNDSEPITKETESMRMVDVQTMFEKIEIGDRAVGFPFKINELPENYTMELPENNNPDQYPLYVNGKREMGVFLGVEFESLDKFYDGTVNHIFWSVSEIDKLGEMEGKILIDGITLGNTMDEVINKFGEPSFKYINEDNGQEYRSYDYYGENKEYISFSAGDGKNIDCISVGYAP